MQIALVAHNGRHAATLRSQLPPEGAITILAPGSMTAKRFDRVMITETFLWSMQRASTEGFALKEWFEDHVKARLTRTGEIVHVG
jgi:hypothetical protein